MRTGLLFGIGAGLVVAVVGYAGYRAGRLSEATNTSWVPKEHVMLAGSMERIQQSLSKGDTGLVFRAVAAYNRGAKSVTNEIDYYLAVMALWEQTTTGP